MNSNQPRDYGQTYRTTNPDRTKIYDYMFFSFTEMLVIRLIHGVKRRERLRNDVIRDALNVKSILLIIEKSQLRWFGHVIRMSEERDVKRMLNGYKSKQDR